MTAEHPLPWLLPITVMLTVFGIYPLLYSVWLSFHKRNVVTRQLVYSGWTQWERLFHDGRAWHALSVTLTYAVLALIIQLVLGMAIAVLLDVDRMGYGVLRALMTLPLVVPPAVTGMMFLLMQDGSFGVLSFYLYKLGLASPSFPILANPHTALFAVLAADIWQWTPFMVLIMLAGLRALPRDPFEAAMIDGASSLQMFWRLTLPMMSKVIAVAVLIRGVDLFRIYDYVYIITGGGPGTETETLSFYAGRIYFTGDFAYAATLSLLVLVSLIITANIFVRLFKVRF